MGEIEKSPELSNDLTDRHEIWHGNAFYSLEPSETQNFDILKIEDGGGRHLEN